MTVRVWLEVEVSMILYHHDRGLTFTKDVLCLPNVVLISWSTWLCGTIEW